MLCVACLALTSRHSSLLPAWPPVQVRFAVGRCWGALQYASLALQADRSLVLEALAQSGDALKFASAELQAEKSLVLLVNFLFIKNNMYAAHRPICPVCRSLALSKRWTPEVGRWQLKTPQPTRARNCSF